MGLWDAYSESYQPQQTPPRKKKPSSSGRILLTAMCFLLLFLKLFKSHKILNKSLTNSCPISCLYFLSEHIVNGLLRITQGFSCAGRADVEERRSGRDKGQEVWSRRGS